MFLWFSAINQAFSHREMIFNSKSGESWHKICLYKADIEFGMKGLLCWRRF